MARSLWKKSLSLVICLSLVLSFLPNIARASTYTDIADSPAKAAIERWSAYGVVHGDVTGAFHPDATVTRAEAAQFVVNLLHLEKMADLSAYTDIDEHAWYAAGLSKCVKAGLISGSGNRLMPAETADRQTVLVLLCLALGIDESLPQADAIVPDDSAIAGWARGYVYALLDLGFDIAKAGLIHPTEPITRAEFVQLLDNLISVYINQDNTEAVVARDGITLTVADSLVLSGFTTYPVVVAGNSEPWVDLSKTWGSYPLVVRANNAIVTGAPNRCSLNTVWAPNCTVNGNIYATYTLQFVDQDGLPVSGVKANLWEDTLCHTAKTTDSTGRITFPMTPYNYHSEILSVPDGYIVEGSSDNYLSHGGGTYVFRLTRIQTSYPVSPEDAFASTDGLLTSDIALPEAPGLSLDVGSIRMDIPEGYQVGDRMPDFSFLDCFGNAHSLYGTLAVKDMVLVAVWNAESFWSFQEMQILSAAYQLYQDNAEIFALSNRDTEKAIQSFARTNGCIFPMGQDLIDLKEAAGLDGDSFCLVIDRYGIITQVEQGPFLLQDDVESLFSTYTAADYPDSILSPDQEYALCDIAPSTQAKLSAALNVPGGTLLFHIPDAPSAWPFVVIPDSRRTMAMAGNYGIDHSRAMVGFQVTAEEGDCLALEYSLDGQQGLGALLLTVDGTAVRSLPGTADWTTYVYPLTAGTHTVTLSFLCGIIPDAEAPGMAFLDNIRIIPEGEATQLPADPEQ